MAREKKNIIYDNCEIYKMDGSFFGFCSKIKLDWYLKKNIAEKIEDKENAIKLKFEPKNLIVNKVPSIKRENKCYVCGEIEGLLKYHLIPPEYKRFLSSEWKLYNNNSTDSISICLDCCGEANSHIHLFKNKLYNEYDVNPDNYIDYNKLELKVLSRKILNNKKNKEILKNKLFLKIGRNLTDKELQEYANCDAFVIYKNTKSPAEYIMLEIIKENKIKEFIKLWKDQFVENMKPLDLPEDFYGIN
jgi:hypothetical protein